MVYGKTGTNGGRSVERPARSRTGQGRTATELKRDALWMYSSVPNCRELGISGGLETLEKVGIGISGG